MWWLGCALATVVLAAGPVLTVPASSRSGERILDYQVDLRIDPSGELAVTERITYDFGGQRRHGIQRDLPVRVRHDDRHDRLYPVRVVGVQAPAGTPQQYRLEDVEGDAGSLLLRIRIGDPDRTVTGRHRYSISYRVQGALDGNAGHDELSWNAIGTRWKVPIGRASATVTAPAAITHVACQAGPSGSRRPCASSRVEGRTASFAAADLGPGEGLLANVGLPSGVVPAPRPVLRERSSLAQAFAVTPRSLGLTGGLLLVLVLGGLLVVGSRNREVAGTPSVESVPPEGVRPGQAGLLVDKAVTPPAIAGTVVDLAMRGYLRIGQVPSGSGLGPLDWRLVQLKDPDGGLLEYERALLAGLFEGPLVVWGARQRSLGHPGSPGGTAVAEEGLASVLVSNLQGQFRARAGTVRSALYEQAVQHGWFSARPDRARRTWTWLGVAMVVAGGGLTVLLAWQMRLGLVAIPIVLAGLALAVAARWLPRRTPKGDELAGRLRRFRADLDRARVEAAGSVQAAQLILAFLPYGITFAVTPRSLAPFIEVAAPSLSTWYRGQRPFAVREFCFRIEQLVSRRPTRRGWNSGGAWHVGGVAGWEGSTGGGGGSSDGGGGGGGSSW